MSIQLKVEDWMEGYVDPTTWELVSRTNGTFGILDHGLQSLLFSGTREQCTNVQKHFNAPDVGKTMQDIENEQFNDDLVNGLAALALETGTELYDIIADGSLDPDTEISLTILVLGKMLKQLKGD